MDSTGGAVGNRPMCSVPIWPSQPCGEANGPNHPGWCLGTIVGSSLREGRQAWKVTMGQERLSEEGMFTWTLQCYCCQPGRKRGPWREESCGRAWPIAGAQGRWGPAAGGSHHAQGLGAGVPLPCRVGTLSRLLAQAHSVSDRLFSRVPWGAVCRLEWSRVERKSQQEVETLIQVSKDGTFVGSFCAHGRCPGQRRHGTLASLQMWP